MMMVFILAVVLLMISSGLSLLFRPTLRASSPLRASAYKTLTTVDVSVLQEGMKYRKLPNSDLVISELGLGTMNFGNKVSKSSCIELLDLATKDYGINFIDTAEAYPAPFAQSTVGKSERIIGSWLKQHKSSATGALKNTLSSSFRDSIVLSTNICGYGPDITWCRKDGAPTQLTPNQIVEAVDGQLERLGTDYIDLLQFHWPDRNCHVPINGAPFTYNRQRNDATPIEDQLQTIADLMKAGKIRSFGLSNETPYGATSFLKAAEYNKTLPRPVSIQNTLNLLEGHNELDMGLREVCVAENGNLGFIASSPLAGGALTQKYLDLKNSSPNYRMREYLGFMYRNIAPPAMEAVRAYSDVIKSYDIPLAPIALAWVASQTPVISTLLGVSDAQQLKQNVQALNLVPLGRELLEEINSLRRKYVDPTKGSFPIIDPSVEYEDPALLPWGSKDEDVDPELDQLINKSRRV